MTKQEALESGHCRGCKHLFTTGPGKPVQLCPGNGKCPGKEAS